MTPVSHRDDVRRTAISGRRIRGGPRDRPPGPDDELKILLASYQINRDENLSWSNAALAIVAAGLVYILGTLGYVEQHRDVSWLVLLLMPLVPLGLLAFFVLGYCMTAVRTMELKAIENALRNYNVAYDGIEIPSQVKLGAEIWEVRHARWHFTVLILVANAVTYLIVAAYTGYAVYHAMSNVGGFQYLIVGLAVVIYGALLVTEFLAVRWYMVVGNRDQPGEVRSDDDAVGDDVWDELDKLKGRLELDLSQVLRRAIEALDRELKSA
jgi:hypothetical protein